MVSTKRSCLVDRHRRREDCQKGPKMAISLLRFRIQDLDLACKCERVTHTEVVVYTTAVSDFVPLITKD